MSYLSVCRRLGQYFSFRNQPLAGGLARCLAEQAGEALWFELMPVEAQIPAPWQTTYGSRGCASWTRTKFFDGKPFDGRVPSSECRLWL